MSTKIISAEAAASLVKNGITLCIGGGRKGQSAPYKLLEALGNRYRKTALPRKINVLHPSSIGDINGQVLDHLAYEGLLDTLVGSGWSDAPRLGKLALENKIKAYNFPEGVLTQLLHSTTAGEKGLLKKTGLFTFVDPRLEGGMVNKSTTRQLVDVLEIHGEEYLFYHTIPIDMAFIGGTSIDEKGNMTMEDESEAMPVLSMAQAARANGGIVVAQVKNQSNTQAQPMDAKVPGSMIDYVVVVPTFDEIPEMPSRSFSESSATYKHFKASERAANKMIADRAVMQLPKSGFVSLTCGLNECILHEGKMKGLVRGITFVNEQGQIVPNLTGNSPMHSLIFPDSSYLFDFIHGGGFDVCYLNFAQIDRHGNVNVSRFGDKLPGCGNFIDIAQNTRKVVFCGTFTNMSTIEPSGIIKFVQDVEQVTFHGRYALSRGQEVVICTEKAVFRLVQEGIELIEIAPGQTLESDIYPFMDFEPLIGS